MKDYIKLYGPLSGLVCIGLSILFFTFNVLLIEIEDTTMQILVFSPVPLTISGLSLFIWPGNKLTRDEINENNISFWSSSPTLHKSLWIFFGLISILFLILQLASLFGIVQLHINNCHLSKYLGLGECF
jgi:hypothetical protein